MKGQKETFFFFNLVSGWEEAKLNFPFDFI